MLTVVRADLSQEYVRSVRRLEKELPVEANIEKLKQSFTRAVVDFLLLDLLKEMPNSEKKLSELVSKSDYYLKPREDGKMYDWTKDKVCEVRQKVFNSFCPHLMIDKLPSIDEIWPAICIKYLSVTNNLEPYLLSEMYEDRGLTRDN